MGEDCLKKAKGFTRTFVIHSNANPYAAAAAMGMMAARNQEAGAYFRPSDTFVPMVEGLAPYRSPLSPATVRMVVQGVGVSYGTRHWVHQFIRQIFHSVMLAEGCHLG